MDAASAGSSLNNATLAAGDDLPVVIVGGGVAGLNCARLLTEAGVDFFLLEAGEDLGGRVRTEEVDGFQLDVGFQVFQTAYPEAKVAYDYQELDLIELEPGAMVRKGGRWITMCDPMRRPSQAISTLFNPIGTLGDRWRLLKLKRELSRVPVDELFADQDQPTFELLKDGYGFSEDFIESFFRPWFSGIFLERNLATSANYFKFVFRMLSGGPIAYPASGIGALTKQLAKSLPAGSVMLEERVTKIDSGHVRLDSGKSIKSADVVLAVDHREASMLGSVRGRASSRTSCLYFSADKSPTQSKMLLLEGSPEAGPVNHAMVLTNSAPRLAPKGKSLISVSLVENLAPDESQVRQHLKNWFGDDVDTWNLLKRYDIEHALPAQPPGFYEPMEKQLENYQELQAAMSVRLLMCGAYCETSSVNGALKSGRLAAEEIIMSRG